MFDAAAAGQQRWQSWVGESGGGESLVGGSWWVGERCDWEVPRGLPCKSEPMMDGQAAAGEGSPRARGFIDGKAQGGQSYCCGQRVRRADGSCSRRRNKSILDG